MDDQRHRGPRGRAPRIALLSIVATLLAATPAVAIVGGTPAPEGRWPWMAGVLSSSESDAMWAQFCGGVVIAPRRVLTTGHCVIDEGSGDIEILIGRTRLSGEGGRRIAVRSISVYPGYADEETPSLDAAVVVLRSDAGVPPVALARPDQAALWAPGTTAWTMGWGQLNPGKSPGGNRYYADRLYELSEPVQGDGACENAFGRGWRNLPYGPAQLFCTGAAGDRAGTCYGDSGAPVVVSGPEGWVDVGIDIAGDACAAPGYFDLNVRVDRIRDFALGRRLVAQPDLVSAPRISGRLRAGATLRCTTGRWRGGPASYTARWRRLGSRHVVGHGRRHRVTRRDAARGLVCTVTASNRGGRMSASAERHAARR